MQFLKRIQPLFLSFTLFISILSFQADTLSITANNTYISWITKSSELSKTQGIYNIKPKKTEHIIGNNFSIFSFKCFIKQHKSLFATKYKRLQKLQILQTTDYLKLIPLSLNEEDDIFIG